MLASDVLTGHEGVETAGVEVSASDSNSLSLEAISQGSKHPLYVSVCWNRFGHYHIIATKWHRGSHSQAELRGVAVSSLEESKACD
ncbi:hypothetical protein R3I93_012708 [Phoxinus phoxinus]|uniref:Uncharacterized protein n=1 Tax=Phoxinus phoxinus TaxID=58324 RepID=A0AAN9CUL1_9TELE